MESVYKFLALRNQAGIQTMATILFTFHSLFLLSQMLAIMGAENVIMRLKHFFVETSFPEICLALVPRMLLLFVTIIVDLVLVIGIEDNSPKAIKLFVNWTVADIVLDSLLCIITVALKSNRKNVKMLLGTLGAYFILPAVKGLCAYRVLKYGQRWKRAERKEDPQIEVGLAAARALALAVPVEESEMSLVGARRRRSVRGPQSDPGDCRTIEDLQ